MTTRPNSFLLPCSWISAIGDVFCRLAKAQTSKGVGHAIVSATFGCPWLGDYLARLRTHAKPLATANHPSTA
jgi:hypothetical protein